MNKVTFFWSKKVVFVFVLICFIILIIKSAQTQEQDNKPDKQDNIATNIHIEHNFDITKSSLKDAEKIAFNTINQSDMNIVKIDSVLVTDSVGPIQNINKTPMWKIEINGIKIIEDDKTNSNIKSLTALVNDESNIVYAVFSKEPKSNGVKKIDGKFIVDNQLSISLTNVAPTLSFIEALTTANQAIKKGLIDVKEIYGYYGKVTDSVNKDAKLKDKNCWILLLGGMKKVTKNKPNKINPVKYVTDAMVVIDADTGEWYSVSLYGNSSDN